MSFFQGWHPYSKALFLVSVASAIGTTLLLTVIAVIILWVSK